MFINRTSKALVLVATLVAFVYWCQPNANTLQEDDAFEKNYSNMPVLKHDSVDLETTLSSSLEMAHRHYQRIKNEVNDYTCVMVKHERIKGEMRAKEWIAAKIRHEQILNGQVVSPLSIYLKYLAPKKHKNREVLFVKGQNEDKLFFRKGGKRLAFISGSMSPDSPMAMQGNRYPLTEFGILRLVERMIEIGEEELPYGECHVAVYPDVLIDKRKCKCIEITHPVERPYFIYHIARIFFEQESGIPIQFESYDWPVSDRSSPILKERYTYYDLELNVGLSDEDFDKNNPEYGF